MTKTLEEMKAEFAARGGQVTVAAAAPAYGVNAEADKASQQAAKDQRAFEAIERQAERDFEFHAGTRGRYFR